MRRVVLFESRPLVFNFLSFHGGLPVGRMMAKSYHRSYWFESSSATTAEVVHPSLLNAERVKAGFAPFHFRCAGDRPEREKANLNGRRRGRPDVRFRRDSMYDPARLVY